MRIESLICKSSSVVHIASLVFNVTARLGVIRTLNLSHHKKKKKKKINLSLPKKCKKFVTRKARIHVGLRRDMGENARPGAYARSPKGEHIAPSERLYLREVGEGMGGCIY